MSVHAAFRDLLRQYGPFTSRTDFPSSSGDALAGRLPKELLDFWRTVGLGVWRRGRFQFCDPMAMTGLTKLVFDGDRDFVPDRMHLYGYGGLGTLFFWSEDRQDGVEVDLVHLAASSLYETNRPDRALEAFTGTIVNLDHALYGAIDPRSGHDVLADLLQRHGGLANGEVLGYVPALAFGGSPDFANLKKLQAHAHFTILAQIGEIELFRIKGGRRFERVLGG